MISRIALFTCFLIGIACVTSQQATIQNQLSTNQTLSLTYQCNFPYATATDNQGIIYSSCAGNNGSQGILFTYRNNQGNMQSGWVTSAGNGSCLHSWGLAVSPDGEYIFATCYGNPMDRTVMAYEKQMNGTTPYYSFMSLNTSMWVCGRDIVYDNVTEDVYAVCGTSLNDTNTHIIKFAHNETTDSYNEMAQDLGIMANYIKYNTFNQELYFATNTSIGYLLVHYPNGTSITMPNNMTIIPVNGTLTDFCEITTFAFSSNSSNTLFVGCTGMSNVAQAFTSYSILRIDINQTFNMINITIPVITTNTTTNLTSVTNITITQNITTFNFTAMNVSYTNSKIDGPDGTTDLTYPADGSCKYPSAMQVDNMNQLYVTCLQNAPQRSVIRYTQINSTYYLPAYVTSSAIMCSHPLPNSLSIDMNNDVIVACSGNNMGLLLTSNSTSNNNSSSSGTGTGTTGIITNTTTGTTTGTATGTTTGTTTGTIIGTTTGSSTGHTSGPTTCVGLLCASSSTGTGTTTVPPSSTGSGNNNTVGNTATTIRGDITGLILALILVVISM